MAMITSFTRRPARSAAPPGGTSTTRSPPPSEYPSLAWIPPDGLPPPPPPHAATSAPARKIALRAVQIRFISRHPELFSNTQLLRMNDSKSIQMGQRARVRTANRFGGADAGEGRAGDQDRQKGEEGDETMRAMHGNSPTVFDVREAGQRVQSEQSSGGRRAVTVRRFAGEVP